MPALCLKLSREPSESLNTPTKDKYSIIVNYGVFMAKILEEVILIKLSKIVKDSADVDVTIADDTVLAALEQVSQELVGDSIVVEVEKA